MPNGISGHHAHDGLWNLVEDIIPAMHTPVKFSDLVTYRESRCAVMGTNPCYLDMKAKVEPEVPMGSQDDPEGHRREPGEIRKAWQEPGRTRWTPAAPAWSKE